MTQPSIDSSYLHLKGLEKEYDQLMTEYRLAYLEYLSVLDQNGSDAKIKLSLPGYIMSGNGSGSSILSSTTEDTLNTCEAQCSLDTSCSGATYNSINKLCVTQKGNITPIKSINTNYAILTDIYQLTMRLKYLNAKLSSKLKEINSVVEQLTSEKSKAIIIENDVYNKLINEYQRLTYDREQLAKLQLQNDDLTKEYEITGITVRQKDMVLFLWFLLALGIIIAIIRYIYYT
jgi:hypothetical protein